MHEWVTCYTWEFPHKTQHVYSARRTYAYITQLYIISIQPARQLNIWSIHMTNIGKQREIQRQTDRQTETDKQVIRKEIIIIMKYLLSDRSVLFPTSMIITSLPLSVRTSSIHLDVWWKEFASAKQKINIQVNVCGCVCVCVHMCECLCVCTCECLCARKSGRQRGGGGERERGRQGGRERARENKFSQSRYILYNCNKLFPRFWREWIMGQGLINYVTNAV